MPKRRTPYKCPVCKEVVLRLTPHLRHQHKDDMGSDYMCRLYANYVHLGGKLQYRGRAYKICPVRDCPSIVADVPLHLRSRLHNMTKEQSRRKSKTSVKVSDFRWTIPPEVSGSSSSEGEGLEEARGGPREQVAGIGGPREQVAGREGPRQEVAGGVLRREQVAGGGGRKKAVAGRGGRSKQATGGGGGREQVAARGGPVEEGGQGAGPGTGFCPIVRLNLLTNWEKYMCSQAGGDIVPQRAREYVRIVQKYVKYFDALHRPAKIVECCSPDHLQEYFEDAGAEKGPSWKLNVINFLAKFLRYLEERCLVPPRTAREFRDRTSGISRSVGKVRTKQRISKQQVKRRQVVRVNLRDFFDSAERKQGIKALARGINEQVYSTNKKYLVASLIVNSGARTGVLSGMTLEEVYGAEEVHTPREDPERGPKVFHVVSVANHKTSYQGPVQVPLANREYRALKSICDYVRDKFPGVQHPFVTGEGRPLTSSRLSKEFQSAWRACGLEERYGRFTPTDHRKYVVTTLLGRFPEMRETLAKQLKHSPAVERVMYDLSTGAALAVDVLQKRRKLHGEPAPEEGDSSEPEAEDRVQDWVANLPDNPEPVEEEEGAWEGGGVDLSASLFSSEHTRSYSKGKTERLRREWTEEAEKAFSVDWCLEIELSVALNKKPTLTAVRQKLGLMPDLAEKYRDLTDQNVKDKIWSLARRKMKR